MERHTAAETLGLAAELQRLVHEEIKPPSATAPSYEEPVIYMALVKGTRGYIERVAHQINGCYQSGWYDASSVMIRRLIETLIIECYETYKIENSIKDKDGNYLFLKDLIDKALTEQAWTIGRSARLVLPKLKEVGDKAAHNRRYNAFRQDIDKISPALRDVVQELLSIARLN
ncbi:hypothetical protein QTH90_08555 [Variovorax sp. J2P1-59]|uniref:hypothetical protein n=1 Tax=Variovorax flavidus TaxID=3053501 RepID=UPI00257767DD|nr:hypothetical protein [Variovorax sp. J2P1-59]MDM0074429.1 hypothetical protein [Variovorax sp. J2P1-59]